jgi:hypothetical protein
MESKGTLAQNLSKAEAPKRFGQNEMHGLIMPTTSKFHGGLRDAKWHVSLVSPWTLDDI